MAALKKTDGKMMIACSDELVAKEAYYHRTCYQSFTRDFLSNKNSESEHCSDKSTAFEKVANFLSHFIKNPQVELTKLTSILETQLLEEEVESETVIKSAKKNLKRKIETEFTEINFVQIGRQCYVYPDTLEISEVITQLETTKKELKELKALSDAEKLVTKCALTVREEVKEKSVNLSWPLKTSELKNENFHCRKLLDLLYTVLYNGEKKSRTNKSELLKQSFTQNLVYAIINGRVKTPKSVLYPYHIKSLTNNTELINITCRLGHGIIYSLLEELSTEIAYQRLEAVEEGSLCLPEDCKTGTFTEVDNNIDRLEETLSCIKCFL